MSGFNLANYEPVEDRNRKFWADHPNGRILTDLVFHDGVRYVVRAEVYIDAEDTRPSATGYAEETVTTRGVNQTSALENCETSAEGRALARLGYAPKGARPSREEMQKAQRQSAPPQQRQPEPAQESGADAARKRLAATCKENGWDLARVAGIFADIKKVPLKDATDVASITKFREYLFTLPQADLMPASEAAA
jgi:hypothetical protein